MNPLSTSAERQAVEDGRVIGAYITDNLEQRRRLKEIHKLCLQLEKFTHGMFSEEIISKITRLSASTTDSRETTDDEKNRRV
jgi:hypothetical protein